jgi:4-hydroxy-tetrahydrodipicolinate synthase
VIEIAAGKAEGRVPLLAGLYAESHRDGVLLAKEAVAAGADALVVFPTPHFAFEVSPEVPYRHFAEVADAVSVPLVVFCYPTWTGMAYTEELLTRICGIPSVAAIKDWTLDIRSYERNMRAVKALRPDIAILSSFSTNLLPSLAVGADGILSGHGSVIADLQVALFEAVRVNDLAVAKGVYERIQILTQVVYRFPMSDMYTRMKQQLVMLGRLTNAHVRPPLLAIADDELSELRSSLTAAGLQ